MMDATEWKAALVNALTESFYRIVPLELKTYCSTTSRISQRVLQHFGIKAGLVPCQMWLIAPEQNFVVGFTGKSSRPGKWDGHVVCGTEDMIIDAALQNFTRDFDLNVPRIAACHRFRIPSQVIARRVLNEQNALWWYHPPNIGDADPGIPVEPPKLVAKYAAELIEYISTTQAVLLSEMAPGVTRMPGKFPPA